MADILVSTYAEMLTASVNHNNSIILTKDINLADEYPNGWSGTPTMRSAVIDGGGHTLYVPGNTARPVFAFGESGTWTTTDSPQYRTKIQNLKVVFEDAALWFAQNSNWGYVTWENCNFSGSIKSNGLALAYYGWGQYSGWIFDKCTFDCDLYDRAGLLQYGQSYTYNEADGRLEIRHCRINLNTHTTAAYTRNDAVKLIDGATFVDDTVITGSIDLGLYYSREHETDNKNAAAIITFSDKGYNNIQGSNFVVDAKLTNSSGAALPLVCYNPCDKSMRADIYEDCIESDLLSVGSGYSVIRKNAGAFQDVSTLEKISIPQSCKKIGPHAFAGTSLKKVKIAPGCEYSATSFPDGCEIEIYGGT